ncbi:hypothetical protein VCHC62B1_0656A, partial [Vibrio cholerae HC-62B1]
MPCPALTTLPTITS